eukprot:scaffold16799_cov73-Phaeocystis_antarctica.AAC.3
MRPIDPPRPRADGRRSVPGSSLHSAARECVMVMQGCHQRRPDSSQGCRLATAAVAASGWSTWRVDGTSFPMRESSRRSVAAKTARSSFERREISAGSHYVAGARPARSRLANKTAYLVPSSAVRVPHYPHGQRPRPLGPVRERFENGDQTLRRDCFGKAQPHGANRDSLGHAATPGPANEAVQPVHQAQGAAACCSESGGVAPLQEKGRQLRLLDPVPQAEGPGMMENARPFRHGHESL